MPEEYYESLVSPDLINDVFSGEILNGSSGKYVILLQGRLVTIKGRVFYDTKTQATKAFYNSFSWKVRRAIWAQTPHSREQYGYWGSPDRGRMWLAFKKALEKNYGFKIVAV